MSKEFDDSGPAFPVPLNEGQSWQGMAPCDGMTLRDYFAAKAMEASIAHGGMSFAKEFQWQCAADAYAMADAMLKAREQKGGA